MFEVLDISEIVFYVVFLRTRSQFCIILNFDADY